jgi:hypothetical protein
VNTLLHDGFSLPPHLSHSWVGYNVEIKYQFCTYNNFIFGFSILLHLVGIGRWSFGPLWIIKLDFWRDFCGRKI